MKFFVFHLFYTQNQVVSRFGRHGFVTVWQLKKLFVFLCFCVGGFFDFLFAVVTVLSRFVCRCHGFGAVVTVLPLEMCLALP